MFGELGHCPINGAGSDVLLLQLAGLKKLLKEGEKLPAIYSDPTFGQSSNWILSTSQLTSEFFEGWGYGEGALHPRRDTFARANLRFLLSVVDEGYGLAYAVNNRSLRFTITSMNKGAEGVQQFRAYLEEAATEMGDVMRNGLSQQKSKL